MAIQAQIFGRRSASFGFVNTSWHLTDLSQTIENKTGGSV